MVVILMIYTSGTLVVRLQQPDVARGTRCTAAQQQQYRERESLYEPIFFEVPRLVFIGHE